MAQFTYAFILFFTVIICFVASFDRRLQFNRYFVAFIKASVLVAIPFIAWDIWFTARGVWWFNSAYTVGWRIGGLPIEELMFFICIPFSCVFTYFAFDKFFDWKSLSGFNNIIVFVVVVVCAVVALANYDKIYTLLTAVVTILTLLYLHFVARVQWISKATVVYGVLMLGFFPVNGILTGTGLESPIVNYNPNDFLGIRMLTIPVEDAVYGYAQFLLVLFFFLKYKQKLDDKLVVDEMKITEMK